MLFHFFFQVLVLHEYAQRTQRPNAGLMLNHRMRRQPNINPLKHEFTILISTHDKPRIAVAILDL